MALNAAEVAALIVGGMAPELAAVHQVLSVCGMTPVERNRMTNEGFTSLADFRNVSSNEWDNMSKTLQSRGANNRIQIGLITLKNLKALSFWAHDKNRRGQVADSNDFTVMEMHNCRDKMAVEASKLETEDVATLPKLDLKKWKQSKLEFQNYLKQRDGVTGVPLVYVVRDMNADVNAAVDDNERMVLQAPLVGQAYNRDNKNVHAKIEQWTLGTDAHTWFIDAPRNDGRTAWNNIVGHYEGAGELNKRTMEAEASLENLHYKKETVFPFEKYVTKLKECFKELEDANQPYNEAKKVQILLKGMRDDTNATIAALKTQVRGTYLLDFTGAANFLSMQIAAAFTVTSGYGTAMPRKRKISAVNGRNAGGGRGAGRGGGGRGRGGGRGGRGGRGGGGRGGYGGGGGQRMVFNDVDIADTNRNFTPQEWDALGPVGRAVVHERRNRRDGAGGGGRGAGGGRGGGGNNGQRNINAIHQQQGGNDGNVNGTDNNGNLHNGNNNGENNGNNGGNDNGNRGNQNGPRFGRNRYNRNE